MNDKQVKQAAAAFLSAGFIYRMALLTLAAMSFRKGHWFLGVAGFIFPAMWVLGAALPRKAG